MIVLKAVVFRIISNSTLQWNHNSKLNYYSKSVFTELNFEFEFSSLTLSKPKHTHSNAIISSLRLSIHVCSRIGVTFFMRTALGKRKAAIVIFPFKINWVDFTNGPWWTHLAFSQTSHLSALTLHNNVITFRCWDRRNDPGGSGSFFTVHWLLKWKIMAWKILSVQV